MREREIEKKLRLGVINKGGECYKWTSPNNRGVPDRIVIMPGGKVYFVEVKAEDGKLSPVQKAQLRRLNKLGCRVRVLYGLAEVDSFLQELDRVKCRGV